MLFHETSYDAYAKLVISKVYEERRVLPQPALATE
jgi:hypothetical protein